MIGLNGGKMQSETDSRANGHPPLSATAWKEAALPTQDPTTSPTEAVYAEIIRSGQLVIKPNGEIWRIANWTNHGRPVPCVPKRAEKFAGKYQFVAVRIDGKNVQAYAHRIVWRHYNGRPIPDGLTINHIDGTKTNNRPENLELITLRENVQHAAYVLGHPGGAKGESVHGAKLTEAKVAEIRLRLATGEHHGTIASSYGVSKDAISNIATGRYWRDKNAPLFERGWRGVPGETHPNAKLTDAQVVEIRTRMANGERTIDVARAFGINGTTVRKIVLGVRRRTAWENKGQS
jgi:hypothetical protein